MPVFAVTVVVTVMVMVMAVVVKMVTAAMIVSGGIARAEHRQYTRAERDCCEAPGRSSCDPQDMTAGRA